MYFFDMYFPSMEDVPDFGTIKMTRVGRMRFEKPIKTDEYGHKINMRLRNYILLSDDISRLDLINNAADGSKAFIADTSETYVLCNGVWRKQSIPSCDLYSCRWGAF